MKKVLFLFVLLTTIFVYSNASENQTVNFTIERNGILLAMNNKTVAEERSFLTYYTCEQKNDSIKQNIGNKPYIINKVNDFRCNKTSEGNLKCYLKLSWPIEVEKREIERRISMNICESIYPSLVSREYSFILEKNTSKKLNLGDDVTFDYEFLSK